MLMNKTCKILASACIMTSLTVSSAHAVTDTKPCAVPNSFTKQSIAKLIENPQGFLRESLKDTHTIRNFKAVKSEDFGNAYFLAGEIVETKTNKSRGIGVWFTSEKYAMSGPATKYSTFLSARIGRTTWDDSGNGYKIKKDVTNLMVTSFIFKQCKVFCYFKIKK